MLARLGAAAVLGIGLAPTAFAAATGRSKHVEVTLLSEAEVIRPGQPFQVGLLMKIERGWHTYWKNPGDAGLPARFKWTLPEGFTAGPIQWPTPHRIAAPPLMSYGYKDEVLLAVELRPPATLAKGQVSLGLRADWLECAEVCLPAKADLDLVVAVADEHKASAAAPLFAEARRLLPSPADGWSLSAEAGPRAVALHFRGPAPAPPSAAYFFPEDTKLAEHAAPQGFEPLGDGHRVTLKPAPVARERLKQLRGVLVVESGGQPTAVQVEVKVAAGDPSPARAAAADPSARPPAGAGRAGSLAVALGFAFVGGLILNLMPCVLPVLSLKVLGFIRHADEKQHAWRHGLVFTLGVVLSFWALAGALLLLRAGGERVGWGFQLQSPPFLVVLSGLFLLLGLNLFGLFEVGSSLTSAGNLLTGRSGLSHSFWNGVLATVVATPCTAPFMGSALGYGLSQPALVALLVFTALGLGMATPYLLLSAVPGLLRFVPKPGPWMETFKQLMGFLLLATVAALVWLFGQQAGVDGMGVLLAALLVTALGAWVYGRGADRPGVGRLVRTAVALALMALGLGLGLSRALQPPVAAAVAAASPSGLDWQEYSSGRLAELRQQGRPVFLDFTAAWCLTCQVNERVALAHGDVVARFRKEGIVALRADWTRRDDHITEALAAYGREGVPVYVLYGPDGAPRLLPELLTPGIVLAALDDAFAENRRASAAGN